MVFKDGRSPAERRFVCMTNSRTAELIPMKFHIAFTTAETHFICNLIIRIRIYHNINAFLCISQVLFAIYLSERKIILTENREMEHTCNIQYSFSDLY